LEPAIVELRRAIELDPTLADAHYTLATTLLQAGDLAASEREMRAGLDARPQWAEAWFLLGTVRRQAGDLQNAAVALREAIRLDPGTPGPFNTLAQVLQLLHDEVGSREAFWKGAEANQRLEGQRAAVFRVNTGYDHLTKGDLPGAEQQFLQAIEKAPEMAKAHQGLADVLRKRGQLAAADRELRLAEELLAKIQAAMINKQMGSQ
jgi:Tfp pilus assembly protein PilF